MKKTRQRPTGAKPSRFEMMKGKTLDPEKYPWSKDVIGTFYNREFRVLWFAYPDGDRLVERLQISRADGQPIRSYRDLLNVKDAVAYGRAAVETFPADSEAVDTGETTNLWLVPEDLWPPILSEEPLGFYSDEATHDRFRQTGQIAFPGTWDIAGKLLYQRGVEDSVRVRHPKGLRRRSWSDLQKVKSEALWEEASAVEFFPSVLPEQTRYLEPPYWSLLPTPDGLPRWCDNFARAKEAGVDVAKEVAKVRGELGE